MARTRHKVSKLIQSDNSPDENRRIAEVGEFAGDPIYEKAFFWRWRSLLAEFAMKQARGSESALTRRLALDKEISEAIRDALIRGDEQFFKQLAKATKFLNEHINWNIKTFEDFGDLLRGSLGRRLRPLDPLRAKIAQQYYLSTWRGDEVKEKRSTFMAHIAKQMGCTVDSLGHDAFSKSFDRACQSLGISWKHNKGKRGAK